MYLTKLARAGVMLAAIASGCGASAQQNQQGTDNQFKEVQVGSGAFTLADPVPSWVDQAPLPELTKPQPIVVRLADTQFMVGQVPAVYNRRAIVVNDPASLTAAGRLLISFAPEYERVQLHSIYIHRAGERLDRTTTSNVRFLQREQGLEQGVYSGRVTASILVDDLRVGDTLESSYSTYGANPVFGGQYFSLAGWDQAFPTLQRRVVVNYPANRQIAWRMIGDRPAREIVPNDSLRDGMHKIVFEERLLPESGGDALTFPDFFASRLLQFSEFSSWGQVANWATTLFPAKASIGDAAQEVVKKIRALPSDEARVTAALEFVQSEIRYFSVSLGESSHRPAPPDVVLQRRYGDCKDKSSLLIALLREVGIQSRPALLKIGRRTGLQKTLPSPQFFDHVIVEVTLGSKVYFLDPTRLGQHGRLDRMGQLHEGAQILVVAADTTELSTISTANIRDLVTDELAERATLSKLGGEGQLEVKHVWNGTGAERLRVLFERASRDRLARSIGDALERRYPGAKLAAEPNIQDDRVNNIFSIAATYKVPNLANDKDGAWIVTFSPENMQNVLPISPSATRTTPLRMPAFPYLAKYSFEITLPEEVSAVTDPRAQTVENKYFSLTASAYFRGNLAKTSIEMASLGSHVEAEDYQKYAEDFRAANKAIGGVVVIGKNWIKSSDAAAKVDFPQRLRSLREEVVKKAGDTIAAGKLTGSDLANAYCVRGIALSELGRYEEALRDVNEALRMAPNATNLLSCRAEVYFQSAQFEKSITDQSTAIALGATDASIFRSRGTSRLYAGRLEEAAADFVKASELADKETKVYCDIWVASVYGRLRKPVPDAIVKRAAAEASGDWPRPALAALTGAMSPADLLNRIDQKKGDERDMALSEGYFYLGQHYLMVGDRKTAQSYFEKTRQVDVFTYTEHMAAGFELQRLAKSGAATSAIAPSAAKSAVTKRPPIPASTAPPPPG
jgi:lipoprotein NlpI/transglutaminase-like putative cysteine protease